jgi:hypothetical protein
MPADEDHEGEQARRLAEEALPRRDKELRAWVHGYLAGVLCLPETVPEWAVQHDLVVKWREGWRVGEREPGEEADG